MNMKLKVKRFNTRRADPVAPTAEPARASAQPAQPTGAPAQISTPSPRIGMSGPPPRAANATPTDVMMFAQTDDGFGAEPFATARAPDTMPAVGTDIDAIRREGLSGRQLRMARRMAQKQGLPATSDFDAVRLLRAAGVDPFARSSMLELISGGSDPDEAAPASNLPVPAGDGVRLPQTIKPMQMPSPGARAETGHMAEMQVIQRDLARRRRRRSVLLMARLMAFVFLPAMLAGYYFYFVATPLYATKTEFVIQQAEPAAAAGMSSLLRGTALATSQDSIAVQGYLQSRDAMMRLDKDNGFRAAFSIPTIDPIQRLDPDATLEAAYKLYQRNVKISFDPTEGLIRMEVIAPDPQQSAEFSRALIRYAEEQVDQLTQRLREDQMRGARQSYEEAEAKMLDAQRRMVEMQERLKVISSDIEVSLVTSQIGGLESQLTTDRLSLAQMESNEQPNVARMEPLKRRIATLEAEIATLRGKLTADATTGQSLAQIRSELLVAEADVATRTLMLQQSLQSMETARVEANRQVRYLSLAVNPVAPDEATYPRAFENTAVALLIFAGIYLMISMTAAILREQVSA
jgi:capsular polysaccharide transport system permease protein